MFTWVHFAIMCFFVGSVGGLVYVNSFTLLLESKKIPQDKKEICTAICALAYSLSIITASSLGFVFSYSMGE